MCWSGEASFVLAAAGLGTTGYAVWTKESPRLYITLCYFSLMELLQAFTYPVIDQCSLASNQTATMLGYLHITFQPFFINALSMYFIPEAVRRKIEWPVYGLCFLSALVMIFQIFPFEWAGHCHLGWIACSDRLCSVSGNWHIAWEFPVNGLMNFVTTAPVIEWLSVTPTYMIVGFILPLLYGSWRFTLYHFLIGPQLSMLLTDNPNEVPAVWCLLSIGILILVVKTPIRKYMFVRKWLLWPKHIREQEAA
ncbi:MAG: hypothetical protein H6857_04630 [Rhodospirillales bacterium]|nr:hypothetical protein [Rhodospirillales bacterium]MCB9973665.1 hypothetical protein [Rhodospirillales bacterium]MCB9980638.1 hypothetical protein [Rhodospirillales bacterium]